MAAQPEDGSDDPKSTPSEKGMKSFGNYGKIEEIETSQLSPEEITALRALKKFDFQFKEYNLYDTIRGFGGGTMVLIETFHADAEGKTVTRAYQVMVKNGRGSVYDDYAKTLRLGIPDPNFVTRATSPDTVVALLTLILVLTFVASLYWAVTEQKSVPEEVKLALTTILGFWFGRQVRNPAVGER